ncbi:MAG: hypothetical protein WC310_02165 [Patescibacteria group bacterium]|jgi:hypothetical protein
MNRLLITAMVVIFLVVGFSTMVFAQDMSVRVRYLNGAVDQVAAFGDWRLNDVVSVGPWVFGSVTQVELDAAVKVKLGKSGLWAMPAFGVISDPVSGAAVYLVEDLIVGYNQPWVEVQSQNLFSDSVRFDTGSVFFERAWVLFGNADVTHVKIGAQVETFAPQDIDDKFLRATNKVGPKVSFFFAPMRFDFWYGLVTNDPTPDVENDTKPTTMFWVWVNFPIQH